MEFDELWKRVWGEGSVQYGNEEVVSREKFAQLRRGIETPANGKYDLKDLVAMDKSAWTEPEWGFPKGRRENNEVPSEFDLPSRVGTGAVVWLHSDRRRLVQGQGWRAQRRRHRQAALRRAP